MDTLCRQMSPMPLIRDSPLVRGLPGCDTFRRLIRARPSLRSSSAAPPGPTLQFSGPLSRVRLATASTSGSCLERFSPADIHRRPVGEAVSGFVHLSQTAPRRFRISRPSTRWGSKWPGTWTCQGAHLMKNMPTKSIEVGRFLVSPMTKPHADGGFTASVSIRSGRGMSSIDRVMRFVPSFPNRGAALRYAENEGTAWARSH